MNNASERLLSAVDILVGKAVSELKFDKTIQAEIYQIANLDTGEYKVKYTGGIISAFANDPKVQYKVGEIVYVTVPEGDFSNKKIISSPVTAKTLSYAQMQELSNSIIEISPNFVPEVTGGVVAGAPSSSDLSYEFLYAGFEDGLFQQYSKDFQYIQIQGSFLTQFHSEHNQGNYGLEIEFFTKSGDEVIYRLDLSAFNGDPYSLSVYSPQSIVVKAQTGYLTGIKSIKLFEENFVYDRYVENGEVTDKENRTVANIWVKDVSIKFVEIRDLTDNFYYLDISAPQGNAFTHNIYSLDLVGRLIYQGENVMNEKTCICHWYERDLSVVLGNENYNKNAGVGWKPIEATNFATLTVRQSDVIHQKQYKLVVIYNESIVMTNEITISNLLSPYDFELRQMTVGDEIELQIINNKDDGDLIGDWYLSYPDGSYSLLDTRKNSIIITDLLIYSAVNFYCGVYNATKTEIIAILEHTITSSESAEDITISYTGEDSFRYDANGDVTIEDAEKERTLQVSLTWREGTGTSYRVEWIGPDGDDITNQRYTPSQSMIENLWVDNSNILHYTIKQKYKVNYNNNIITVKIITIDGKEYAFKKEILFLKDGDQGTNGTTYIATIRPYNTSNGQKLSGLNPLIYRNNSFQNTLPLRCYVYKDGELINDNTKYELTYKWTGTNVSLINESRDDVKHAQGYTLSAGAYVKVQISINDKMNGREYDIYCSYPIDIAVGFADNEISRINIDNIPSYIKYTSSGVNPSFYSNNITSLYDGVDYSSQVISQTPNILAIDEDNGFYYLKPASSFVFENNSIALLKCNYSGRYLLHPVMLYLDTYGNEAINGWDGTTLDVNENGGYIFAPQVGAGQKDSANRFTGIVIGKDSGQDKIGLYGYQAGVSTFGLMEDGKAFFGAKTGGGQIILDGTSAKIYGGGDGNKVGGEAANGMTITLANLNPSNPDKASAIKIGAGIFEVKYNGALIASSADITGTIYALKGKIGSTSKSSNDGWTIETNRLYSGTGATRVELNSQQATNTTTPTNNNDFAIWAGSATATSAKFSVSKGGLITAKEGAIGGWKLSSTKLTSNNGKIGLASSGTYRFWSGADTGTGESNNPTFNTTGTYFYVDSAGKMSCRNAEVRGAIYASSGEIGGWYIRNNRLENSDGSIYLGPGGLQVGNNFSVSSSGNMTVRNATVYGTVNASSGQIGSWYIGNGAIWAGDTILTSSGIIQTETVNITGLGNTQNYTGYMGMIGGNDGAGATYNLGLYTPSGSEASIILKSGRNIALQPAAGHTIVIGDGWALGSSSGYLRCTIPKANQVGIYAQFA